MVYKSHISASSNWKDQFQFDVIVFFSRRTDSPHHHIALHLNILLYYCETSQSHPSIPPNTSQHLVDHISTTTYNNFCNSHPPISFHLTNYFSTIQIFVKIVCISYFFLLSPSPFSKVTQKLPPTHQRWIFFFQL